MFNILGIERGLRIAKSERRIVKSALARRPRKGWEGPTDEWRWGPEDRLAIWRTEPLDDPTPEAL